MLNPLVFGGLGVVVALALVIFKKTRWVGVGLGVVSVLFAYASCTALGEMPFLRYLEWKYPRLRVDQESGRRIVEQFAPDYIVVLGGGNREARADEAARLKKAFPKLKIIVTGGDKEFPLSAAQTSQKLIRDRMGISADEFIKIPGRDTESEAVEVANYLRETGGGKVILVTGAVHMPRAALFFRAAGVECLPSPAKREHPGLRSIIIRSLVPSRDALRETHLALAEFVAFVWAKVKMDFLENHPKSN
ncbi:YdcF family protein [Oscillatoria laete-virens NRMC-F 0139]|nr:YdcF family protein [Oscillatoria laete-virens NRMC-F 0139]